ncbi:MAG: hypothetical protein Ct9H90mP22_3300 [Gammaproteobacteria bacterium]|nr:MAG: hypothetical protein Ct9H90mP22_3300 [Gammaproteobacteria bacterium]
MESEGSDFRTSDYPNSDPWGKAEIPAANGHGTAAGIAKFFGILAKMVSAMEKNFFLLK